MRAVLFFLMLTFCVTTGAQDADSIHAESAFNHFPITAKRYNEITNFKIGYFTSWRVCSTIVFKDAIDVFGVLANGLQVHSVFEITIDDRNFIHYTGKSESCTSWYRPQIEFTDFGCFGRGVYSYTEKF